MLNSAHKEILWQGVDVWNEWREEGGKSEPDLSRLDLSNAYLRGVKEVETALAREREEKQTVLFPIRLDDTVMEINNDWPSLVKNTRNIGDFRKWRNVEALHKAFTRLLRDLKSEAINS